ncbi:serine/threonine-protein kinase [Streptomyces sp. NPDC046203]|uniref:serine/threonine-protein kinase n=1 Tax=Streptomyces sp. NPDC046203 TaxID=3154602 RepID=UPI0033FFA20F
MPPLRNAGPFPEAERPDYAGQYRLGPVLGSGGMGVVRLAMSDSGLRLAVKVVHADHAADPEFRARFRQEVAAARRVSGAFTAPVVDADPDAERPWMATLFIDGPTLSDRVKRGGPLGLDELRRLASGLSEALRDIHRAGVVHRDLKPGNVLLAPDGPKVIDFGISRPADSMLHTETGRLIGTPPFMAPEQFQRPREVGSAADVFALGAVLVHAATGRGPFDSDSPYIVAYQVVHDEPELSGVPDTLAPLLRGCLAKDPAERPTADEIMARLRHPAMGAGARTKAGAGAGAGADSVGAGAGAGSGAGAIGLVPAQRRPVDGETAPALGAVADAPTHRSDRRAGKHDAERAAGRTAEVANGSRTDGGRTDGGRRRGLRWTVALPLLATLAVGTLVGVRVWGGGPDTIGPTANEQNRTFRPWETALADGTGEGRPPLCTAAGSDVYCSGPKAPLARLDADSGTIVWTARADDGGQARESRAPVLSGGLVLAADGAGSRLDAYAPEGGDVVWSTPLAGGDQVVPAGGTVLLVSPRAGQVRALDGATGRELWSKRIGGAGTRWLTAPDSGAGAEAGTGAGAGAGTEAKAGTGTGAGTAYTATPAPDGHSTLVGAVRAADGTVLWTRQVPGLLEPVGATGSALLLLSDDLDGFTDAVVRVDLADRAGVRRVPLAAPMDQAQAAVAGDVVHIVGVGGTLVAVDTARSDGAAGAAGAGGTHGADDADKAQLWRLETEVARSSRPVVADGRVLLTTGDGRLLAVDAARGELLGQTRPRTSGGRYPFTASLPAPVVLGPRAIAGVPDGSVFAVDATDPESW